MPLKSNITSYDVESFSIYYVFLTRTVYLTYRLRVKKYLGILLYFDSKGFDQFTVFVGPGFLSKKIDITSDNTTLYMDTFQCILRAVKRREQSLKVTYKPRHLVRAYVNLITNEKHNLKCRNTRLCILHFHCPDSLYVNLTISSYVYMGPPSDQCSLGGLALYDNKLGDFEEEFILCNRHNYFVSTFELPRQVISSSNSSALLILYSYKEYSHLILNGSVSITSCKGTKINICALNYMAKYVYRLNKDQIYLKYPVYSHSSFMLYQYHALS